MDKPDPPLKFIYNYVDEESFHRYFRLTIIVCLYIFVRGYYSNWAKQRHIRTQLELDKKEKELEQEREESQEAEKIERFEKEAKSFGWGKATRRNVKQQERILKGAIEEIREGNQSAYDAAEDHDIDEFLE